MPAKTSATEADEICLFGIMTRRPLKVLKRHFQDLMCSSLPVKEEHMDQAPPTSSPSQNNNLNSFLFR